MRTEAKLQYLEALVRYHGQLVEIGIAGDLQMEQIIGELRSEIRAMRESINYEFYSKLKEELK